VLLPYFKVNICPFPLPHFASICFAYLWSFRWPNYIVTLPRYFSFRLPHLNIPWSIANRYRRFSVNVALNQVLTEAPKTYHMHRNRLVMLDVALKSHEHLGIQVSVSIRYWVSVLTNSKLYATDTFCEFAKFHDLYERFHHKWKWRFADKVKK
jgi:hypothetical protein